MGSLECGLELQPEGHRSMAKQQKGAGSAQGTAAAKKPRAKRVWENDVFAYNCEITLSVDKPISEVTKATEAAGGTLTIKNRRLRHAGGEDESNGDESETPTNEEIESAAR